MTTFSQLDPEPSSDGAMGYWKLADGVELLGEFDGPAFEQRPGLVRRKDGQVIQVSPLLYAIAESLDGEANAAMVAQLVSTRVGRELSSENVDYLLTHRLIPLGLVSSDAEPAVQSRSSQHRSKPLLALRFRSRLVPERAHRTVTLALRPLFHPLVITAVLGLLVTLDVAVAKTRHDGVAAATRLLAIHPALLLLVTVLLFASAAFHEIGHATAARYGGATPGVMGVGIYLVWPVFYTDLSDVYRLGRRSRIRADLGGVYFNAIVITIADAVFVSTHYAPLLVFIVLAHIQLLYQFMPFVRMDGYWILSDLVGVPNLFAYIGPVLASMRKSPDPRYAVRLARIRPWARRVISAWVAFTVAILGVNAAIIVLTGPRILTTDLVACRSRATALVSAFEHANVLGGINDLVAFILLAIPGAGILLIAWLLTRRAARLVVSWWPLHRTRATALGLVSLAALGTFAFKFVPNDIARPLMGRTGGSFFDYQAPTLALPRSPSARSGSVSAAATGPSSEKIALRSASNDQPRTSGRRSATRSTVDRAPTGRAPSLTATPVSTEPTGGASTTGTGGTSTAGTGAPPTVGTGGPPTTGTGGTPTAGSGGSPGAGTGGTQGDTPASGGTSPTASTGVGVTVSLPATEPTTISVAPVSVSTTIPPAISAGVSATLPVAVASTPPTSVVPASVSVSTTISAPLPTVTIPADDAATTSTPATSIEPSTTPTTVAASTSASLPSVGAGGAASAGLSVSATVSATLPTSTTSADDDKTEADDDTTTDTPAASVESPTTTPTTISANASATVSTVDGDLPSDTGAAASLSVSATVAAEVPIGTAPAEDATSTPSPSVEPSTTISTSIAASASTTASILAYLASPGSASTTGPAI
jgi:putative peptide zinc metalloprotease protein